MSRRPRVGVSSCLLGQRVRYDGAQKAVPWVSTVLSQSVELVAICPEVGAGMSVPRPPIQLVKRGAKGLRIELVTGTGDVHSPMRTFCDTMRDQLASEELHGYLFKARSPSCGVVDTPHISEDGIIVERGAGIWAQTLLEYWPDLPVADENGIAEDAGCDAFLRRVTAFWRGEPK